MKFIHDQNGPEMLVKHVVWANQRVFNLLINRGRYSTGNIMMYSNYNTGRLGIGSVSLPTFPISSAASTNTSQGSPLPILQLPGRQSDNVSIIMSPADQTTASRNLSLSDTGIQLHNFFRPSGASFQDFQVFNASLEIMVGLAEIEDQQSTTWHIADTYNEKDDFTLSVRPAGAWKYSQMMSIFHATQVLAYFPITIPRYAELRTAITLWGKPVGVLCLDKGDRRGWPMEGLCELPDIPSDETATS